MFDAYVRLRRGLVACVALSAPVWAGSCVSSGGQHVSKAEAMGGLEGRLRSAVELSFARGQWDDALSTCQAIEDARPDDCGAHYCDFVARTMQAVDRIDDFLTPHSGLGLVGLAIEMPKLDSSMADAIHAADAVIARSCEYDLPTVPIRVGAEKDPILRGDIRGRWTVRDAHLMAALFSSMRYVMNFVTHPKRIPVDSSESPPMPQLLADMQRHLVAEDALLFSQPADPSVLRGGWHDRNGNHLPDGPDELLVDIFEPGTQKRIFDFSDAEFVKGEALPSSQLTPTAALPPAHCGYQKFHVDDVVSGSEVSTTDGMTFTPDGSKVLVPLLAKGKLQIHLMDTDGKNRTCLTCGQPGNNDGVRWRPGPADAILFVSDRDHPFAFGNDGGGYGQELYAMRPDGSDVTRLTTSHVWAANYHPNWSPDGKRIVWGRTEDRTWDVDVADFVSDAKGMRLESVKRVVHDTTWWETHGFTPDGRRVITTNTRAGMLATDIYAVEIDTGKRERLTTPAAWDEHAHLSPDGRKLAWISGRFRAAPVVGLSDGSISPVYDFMWIGPGIFFDLLPSAGYSTELTMMDADGTNLQRLTTDDLIVADNEWSPDGRRIIFRQSDMGSKAKTKIRLLSFDDCR